MICLLLLLAYIFDITSAKTKVPSILLLLLLGLVLRLITDISGASNIPKLESLLPFLGTLGLILIVLEGALELELGKSKQRLIITSSFMAVVPMLLLSLLLAGGLNYLADIPFKIAFTNVIPLCIISSAIAIPSARNLAAQNREFITYESSLSDIVGVILFNFTALNDNIGTQTLWHFSIELVAMLVIAIISSLGLSFLIANIKHHVKFTPIILLTVLIYTLAKSFHLPALIFVLFFGLALNNIEHFKHFKIINRFHTELFAKEVNKFAEITMEFAFLIRALFFILFGFLLEIADIINLDTLPWAISIVVLVFVFRALGLWALKLPFSPLLFIAPRGLITILLFLSIPPLQKLELVNNALIVQIILICAIIMMLGSLFASGKSPIDSAPQPPPVTSELS